MTKYETDDRVKNLTTGERGTVGDDARYAAVYLIAVRWDKDGRVTGIPRSNVRHLKTGEDDD